MDWFNNLLNSAQSFMGTPAGQNLAYPGSGNTYASPNAAPVITQTAGTGSSIPTWLWFVLGGGALLLIVFLASSD